jgi:hypothetical protein
MAMGEIINEAIRESGWLDSINNKMGQMVPNPRNRPLITEFLKRFGSKYVWQTKFQTFMKTVTQIDNPGTHHCLTWDVFNGRLLIYGRNLHAIATEYHNGAPPGLKALFKDVDKKENEKTLTESKSPQSTSSKSDHKNDKTKDKEGKKDKNKLKCFGCGRTGHNRKDCLCTNHPDYNKSSDKWEDSANGKAWLAHSLQSKILPMKVSLSGEPLPRGHMEKIDKYLYHDLTCSICLVFMLLQTNLQ